MRFEEIDIDVFRKHVAELTNQELCQMYDKSPRSMRRWKQRLREHDEKLYSYDEDIEAKLSATYDVTSDDKKKIHYLEKQVNVLKSSLKEAREHIHTSDDIKNLIMGVDDYKYTSKKLPDLNKLNKKVNGVPVLMLSDLHYGEVVNPPEVGNVNKYNSEIAEARINYVVDSAIRIVKKDWTAYTTEWFVLPLVGDMLSGSIHDELAESNDKRILPSMLELTDILIHQIEKLKTNFSKIYVPCVVGNHGRLHRKFRAKGQVQENYEYVIYKLVEKHYINDKNVVVQVSESPDMRFDIFEKRFLLTHGNTLGGGGGGIAGILPLLYRGNYKKQERAASIKNGYDTMLIGHFHQSLFLGKVIVNGTTKGVDEYALNLLNIPFEAPSQNLFMVDRNYNDITYRLPVFCEESDKLKVEHTIKTY